MKIPLTFLLLFVYFETGFLCTVMAILELALQTMNSKVCFWNAEAKGVCHHTWIALLYLAVP